MNMLVYSTINNIPNTNHFFLHFYIMKMIMTIILKNFFLAMFHNKIGHKPGKSSPSVLIFYLNRSGVWSTSREGALDVRESQERRDKIVRKKIAGKQKKRNFGPKFSTFLSRIACCSRESRLV